VKKSHQEIDLYRLFVKLQDNDLVI
jgi:hypothetical protein